MDLGELMETKAADGLSDPLCDRATFLGANDEMMAWARAVDAAAWQRRTI